MAEIAEAAEEAPEIHGRAARGRAGHRRGRRSCTRRSSSPTSSTPRRSSSRPRPAELPRACAKYRRRRPIIALAHSPRVADQLTLEWGVYPTSMPVADSVDDLIDTALVVARDFAGLSSGALVVLTAGRRTGTPGATNLIMVREIP